MKSQDVALADYVLRCAGSRTRLAAALQQPIAEVEKYLNGEAVMPQPVFVRAIDIAVGRDAGRDKRGRSITRS